MEIPTTVPIMLSLVLAAAPAAPLQAAERPTPSQTPTPASLAEYARGMKLKRDATDDSDRITIDNANVQAIGRDRALVLGVAAAPPVATPRTARDEAAARSRWRSRHDAQRRRIAEVERKIEVVDRDIDVLNRQRLTPRVMVRLDAAKAKLADLERQLDRRRAELGRIIREARQEGAEPGWFR